MAIVIFNTESRRFIFVQQFRPAVYMSKAGSGLDVGDQVDTDKFPGSLGLTLELCAGIVDKKLSLEEIAVEEVKEECGYQVSPGKLTKIVTFPWKQGEILIHSAWLYSRYRRHSDSVLRRGRQQ